MMLGSLLSPLHAKFSSLACAISTSALAIQFKKRWNGQVSMPFCLFEACIWDVFTPPFNKFSQGTLISSEHRVTVTPLYRRSFNFCQARHASIQRYTTTPPLPPPPQGHLRKKIHRPPRVYEERHHVPLSLPSI